MPLHRHEPVDEKTMEAESPRNSICETLRQAYQLINGFKEIRCSNSDLLDEAKLKLREATAMAKAMSAKLSETKPNWYWNFWDLNPDGIRKQHEAFFKPIDVLMIAYDDFANTMFRFWMCAKHLGLNAIAIKGVQHPFRYPFQAPLHPSLMNTPINAAPLTVMAPGLEHMIESSRVIHLFTSTYPMCAAKWDKHPVIVQHGGTYYRQNPGALNKFFNGFTQQSIIQCPDLLGLGAKNETLIYYPVDTNIIRPDFSRKNPDKLVVGHFPSNPEVKGTETIYNAVKDIPGIEYVGAKPGEVWALKPWTENLKRFLKCDVIIETCAPEQNGKPFGEWGNTALEAAASGCIVVSNCTHKDIYEREYGALGLHVANSGWELNREIYRLTTLMGDRVLAEKKACCEWATNNHSIPVTAERLWNRVYSRYF
jgi:hypothetical protein